MVTLPSAATDEVMVHTPLSNSYQTRNFPAVAVDVVVQSPQAEEIKKAVAKNAKPKTAGNKPVVPKTAAEKKKNKKPSK
jgi:hypothetical protein